MNAVVDYYFALCWGYTLLHIGVRIHTNLEPSVGMGVYGHKFKNRDGDEQTDVSKQVPETSWKLFSSEFTKDSKNHK